MNTKVKYLLTFVAGVIVGAVLISLIPHDGEKKETESTEQTSKEEKQDDGEKAVYFKQPGQDIPIKELRIMEVYEDGSALATAEDIDNIGLVVAFLPNEEQSLYDNQRIVISKNRCLKQIGTYRYLALRGMKTVPIVKIFDK